MRQRSIALERHPFFPAAANNGGQPKALGRRYALGGGDAAKPDIHADSRVRVILQTLRMPECKFSHSIYMNCTQI